MRQAKLRLPSVKTACFWCVCALVPIVMLCAIACMRNVYPFGGFSFLSEDLNFQYIDFFTWYRRVLLGQESIFYSTAQGLGCNTWGLYSYYLASPFNLLILLFDADHLTLAIFCIVALKLSCMQLSATWYLVKRFHLGRPWAFVAALGYTWSLWSMTNLRNPLWLDALILLPLSLYGVWSLVRYGRWKLLCAVSVANVICCWYTAYMSILFLVFVTVLEWWCLDCRCGGHLFFRKDDDDALSCLPLFGLALRFAVPMVVALLLSAWTFVPTVFAMSQSGGGTNTGLIDILKDIVSQDSFGASIRALGCCGLRSLIKGLTPLFWDPSNSIPQVWCGLFLYTGAGAFLANGSIRRRCKLGWVVLLVIVLSGIVFSPVQAIWCGFRAPNGFYSRVAMFVAPCLLWATGREIYELQESGFLADRLALSKIFAPMLCVLVMVDLMAGAYSVWGQLYAVILQPDQDFYAAESSQQVAQIRAKDSSAWRFERTYTRSDVAALNEGLAAQYDGISSYSSAHNSAAINFLNALGYSKEGEFSTRYAHPILLSDALLGVKYVSTQTSAAGLRRVDNVSDFGGGVYQNPYALGLGYVVSGSAVDAELEGANPFERQNSFASALVGHRVELFKKADASEVASGSDRSRAWSVNVSEGCLGYAYVDAPDDDSLMLSVDGASELENWRFQHALVPFEQTGNIAGEPHLVEISPESDAGTLSDSATCLFYELNFDALQSFVNALSECQVDFTSFDGGCVSGTVSVEAEGSEGGYVLLSIPHESGWSVRVNGKEVQATGAFDGALTIIPVDGGVSTIEMTYVSPGFFLGCFISISTAVVCLIALTVRRMRVHRRRCVGGLSPEA